MLENSIMIKMKLRTLEKSNNIFQFYNDKNEIEEIEVNEGNIRDIEISLVFNIMNDFSNYLTDNDYTLMYELLDEYETDEDVFNNVKLYRVETELNKQFRVLKNITGENIRCIKIGEHTFNRKKDEDGY